MLIAGKEINKGLVIDSPWIDYILAGKKCWEMRSKNTKMRGEIALIKKGTGTVVGIANLTDSLPKIAEDELMAHFDKHQVNYADLPELTKWNTPWVLEDVIAIEPTPYTHPNGAVTWVNL